MTDRRICLDANILIYLIEGGAGDDVARLLTDVVAAAWASDGPSRLVLSELAFAEVLVRPFRDGASELVARYEAIFTVGSGIEIRPVSREVLAGAARLRAGRRSLKLPDAIHIATGLLAGCDRLLTGDRFGGRPEDGDVEVTDGAGRMRIVKPTYESLAAILEELSR